VRGEGENDVEDVIEHLQSWREATGKRARREMFWGGNKEAERRFSRTGKWGLAVLFVGGKGPGGREVKMGCTSRNRKTR